MSTLWFKRLVKISLVVSLSVLSTPVPAPAADPGLTETLLQNLIRLDKGLNEAFKLEMSRLDKHEQETLRKEQLQWINERDRKCQSAFKSRDMGEWLRNAAAKPERGECVLEENKNRILQLQRRKSDTAGAAKTKYPPYPVWEWNESKAGSDFMPEEGMFQMPNGDILIPFKRSDGTEEATTFFERKLFHPADAKKIMTDLKSRLRSDLSIFSIKAVSDDGTFKIKPEVPHDLACYLGPNRHPYTLVNQKSQTETTFTVFRVLDKQEEFDVDGRYIDLDTPRERENENASCQSQEKMTVTYKVESVTGQFMFLKDNTFLFRAHETGEVVRLDTDLHIKSTLAGINLFFIPNSGSPYLMEELIGEPGFNIGPQEEADQLYKFLVSRKGKRRLSK